MESASGFFGQLIPCILHAVTENSFVTSNLDCPRSQQLHVGLLLAASLTHRTICSWGTFTPW